MFWRIREVAHVWLYPGCCGGKLSCWYGAYFSTMKPHDRWHFQPIVTTLQGWTVLAIGFLLAGAYTLQTVPASISQPSPMPSGSHDGTRTRQHRDPDPANLLPTRHRSPIRIIHPSISPSAYHSPSLNVSINYRRSQYVPIQTDTSRNRKITSQVSSHYTHRHDSPNNIHTLLSPVRISL